MHTVWTFVDTGHKSSEVTVVNVVPQIDKPQLDTSVQQSEEISYTQQTNKVSSTISPSLPKNEAGLPNMQGGVK